MRNPHAILAVALILLAPLAVGDESQQGLDAYSSADYETALSLWQPLAEGGDAGSQFGLGQMYGKGFGVMMDDALAIKWYGLAADQGHAQAQNNLAIMHQNGWGVAQSDAEAMSLFLMAAEQGVTAAMLALGRFYSMDFGSEYDPVQAYKWFSVAVLLDDYDASAKRDTIAAKMTPEQVAEGSGLVQLWTDSHTEVLANQQFD
jgi:TPR repeat protein